MADTFNENATSDKNKIILAQNVAAISNYLKNNNYRFSVITPRDDMSIFNLVLSMPKKYLDVKIVAETNPNVCKISAEFPVLADVLYNYPFCYELAKENLYSRYARLDYNEDTGQVTCGYSFSAQHGICDDDFDVYFSSVVMTAFKHFNNICKSSAGKFSDDETDYILDNIKRLASDIVLYG